MSTIERGRTLVGTTPRTSVARTSEANTVATPAVQPTAQRTGAVVDGFDSAKTTNTVAAAQVFTAPAGSKDKVYDGKLVGAGGQTFEPGTPLSDIPAFTPKNNPNATATLIYTNGMRTEKDKQARELQALADETGMRTIGVHNSTEGTVGDLLQAVKDKLGKGTNPAVDTLADAVYGELKAGRDVHLVGYSQGGLITSRALSDVARRLRIEDGMSPEQVQQTMSKLNVETFAAAACTYPDGPNYVHYINNRDAVPTLFGLGGKGWSPADMLRHAGKDAKVHYFSEDTVFSGAHSLVDTYLNHRVPFEQARAGEF
ncbi:hypothetical protein HUA74_39275 [Myxococcus sp. CA051A]|uniref:DUF676 domain-containing protein n=1 Tax=Myxococcus llanfairpwllgwyngyllgogerychwyrndrobwllllantysiliogogogochensis TaxID=2590453 RepID=A0A540X2U3_9BACT|nr:MULTISPECIES: hypothetical protein [Myxococcus]NTX07895.1 hypothetical protein [Myxococcus sp. CA040A]NTX14874.1 hypothetical protein [Myxococcus sp. CA056]NTX57402.1 hypothetical protein [Myxococcus sp. CA039A]NTX66708.1 hypothetical protein [Myxococcus sp. CA051A]TQF15004.1 hypothetical protein FJV41_15580 [Myxococcus llanfairpwllgwyngyllgogerychwyrndrobwllllantysiliogogogochensis]